MFIPVQLILYWDRILIDHARKLTRVLTCVHHNFGLTAENGEKSFQMDHCHHLTKGGFCLTNQM